MKNAYYKVPSPLERAEGEVLELETLPNIDINIKCGNSLLSRFPLDADVTKALKSIKYDIKAYRGFVNDYKNERNRDVKRGLQKIIDGIKSDIVTQIRMSDPRKKRLDKLLGELYHRFTGNMLFEDDTNYGKEKKTESEKEREKLETEIDKINKELEEARANAIYKNAFEWRFEFPEVLNNEGNFEGFDAVITNPPYIRQEELTDIKKYLREKYKVFAPGGDIFSYFYELSFGILKQKGILAFINNTFDKTTAGKVLREFLVDNFKFKRYIDFTGVVVFDEATTYPVVLVAEKTMEANSFRYFKFTKDNFSNKELLSDENVFVNIQQNSLKSSWNFLNELEYTIILKIGKHKSLFKLYGKCYYGIKTGLNEAFVTKKDLGNFSILKPVYDGKDLKKWLAPAPFKKMIVFESKSTKQKFGDLSEEDALKKMQENHPLIMQHLIPFTQAAKQRYDKGEFWWELRNCAYYDLFSKPKIIFPNLQNTNKFAFDELGVFLNAPAVFLPTNDTFLLAVLNSKVVWHFLKSICVIRSGGFIEVKPQYFEQIPIPDLSTKEKEPFIDLVEQILKAKQQNQDTTLLEKQIDELVYKLYDITPEEQKIIEGTAGTQKHSHLQASGNLT